MYLKQSRYKNGRTFLSIVKSYRDTHGRKRQMTVQKLGYLDDLQKEHDDPVEHFKRIAKEMTESEIHTIEINTKDTFDPDTDSDKCIGYFPFTKIFQEMGIYQFLKQKQRRLKIEYSLTSVLELLVFGRLLIPCSKKATHEKRDTLFDSKYMGISLDDIYRSLDLFHDYSDSLQKLIWKKTSTLYSRDASTCYYDCTNYYFEIKNPDEDRIDENGKIIEKGLRKRGPEKNKRPDPIVEMGLLMDATGIPMAYQMFPGNESEKLSLIPIIQKVKKEYGVGRTIVVADRGLNTSDNIFYTASHNDRNPGEESPFDGYVYGQSIRGASKEFKKWAIDPKGFVTEWYDKKGNSYTFEEYNSLYNESPEIAKEFVAFTHKSKIDQKSLNISTSYNRSEKKHRVDVTQRQMVYYSQKYAIRQKREREKMIEKAKNMIAKPASYTKSTSYGAAGYIKDIKFNSKTGEIITDKELVLDEALIEEEEKYDGYYSIVTSELELSDKEIRDIYRGLARIEDTFKVSKSSIKARPVHVWNPEHIQAHFLTCYLALMVIRLLEKKLDNRYSPDDILDALRNYRCAPLDANYHRVTHKDPLIDEIGEAFGLDMDFKTRPKKFFKKILAR